MTFANLAI